MPKLSDDVKFIVQIKEFVTVPNTIIPKSKWLYGKFLSVYLRNGQRIIDGSRKNVITIANVMVKDKFQGKGIYNDFLLLIESLASDIIFVENVQLIEHNKIYLDRGYQIDECSCFYKSLKENHE